MSCACGSRVSRGFRWQSSDCPRYLSTLAVIGLRLFPCTNGCTARVRMSFSRTTPGPQNPGHSPSAGRPCVMRAWSRAGVCSPNPPTLCPDTSCCRSILPIPNTCCSGRWEGWSVGGNSGICQASISCSPWTRRRRKRFPQDCSAPAPYLWSTCSSAWRNPSGWITSARDTCSCRICGTGTVRKSIP